MNMCMHGYKCQSEGGGVVKIKMDTSGGRSIIFHMSGGGGSGWIKKKSCVLAELLAALPHN